MDWLNAKRVIINTNGPKTIQSIDFVGEGNEKLTVMFDQWGYAPEPPVRMVVSCGGFIVGENSDGEAIFGKCFLLSEKWNFLVLMDANGISVEESIQEIQISPTLFTLVTRDEDDETPVRVEIPFTCPEKGNNEYGFRYYVWDLKYPVRILVVS